MRNLKRLLQFEPRFGWSELMSLVALVVAMIAFYQGYASGKPKVVVASNLPIAAGRILDEETGLERYVAVLPFLFTNVGGRATSLVTLGKDQDIPIPPLVGFMKNRQVPPENLSYQFFLVPKMIEDSGSLQLALRDRKPFNIEDRPLLNITIPSGESRDLYLGVIVDLYGNRGRKADSLVVSIGAEFGHGTIVPLRGHIDVSTQ